MRWRSAEIKLKKPGPCRVRKIIHKGTGSPSDGQGDGGPSGSCEASGVGFVHRRQHSTLNRVLPTMNQPMILNMGSAIKELRRVKSGQAKRNRSLTAELIVLVVSIGVAMSGPADGSCGIESCPLDLTSVKTLKSDLPGALGLHFDFEDVQQDVPRFGSETVAFQEVRRPDHDELQTSTRTVNLRGSFTVSPVWSLDLTIPIVRRKHSHITASGHHGDDEDDHVDGKVLAAQAQDDHEEDHDDDGDHHGDGADAGELDAWRYTELGDITAWTRLRLAGNTSEQIQLTASLGLTLPTGTTRVRNSEGTLAEPSLQPGSGGFGFLAELSSRGLMTLPLASARQPSLWYASARLRLNLSGDDGYRFGHEAVSHAGIRVSLSHRTFALTQLVYRWRGEDGPGRTGELVDATGGSYVYLSPGLQVELAEGMSLYGYYQLPLYQRVNDVQITSDRNLLVGLGYSLH